MARETLKQAKEDSLRAQTLLKSNQEADTNRRVRLSAMLGSYKPRSGYGGDREREVDVLSWEEIFWKLGELQADANYSCILEERDNWRNWAQEARGEAAMLRDVFKKNNIEPPEPPEPPHHDGFGLGQPFPMRPRA